MGADRKHELGAEVAAPRLDAAGNERRVAAHQGTPNPFVLDATLVDRAFYASDSGAELVRVSYTFEGNGDCPTSNDGPETIPPELGFVSFSDFARTGVECSGAQGVFNSDDWPGVRSESDYVSFTVDPAEAPLNLVGGTISFMVRRSATGPPSGQLLYRVGSSGDFTEIDSWELADTDEQAFSLSLPSIAASDVVEFRFVGWGATSGQGTLRFDDVVLSLQVLTVGVNKRPHRSESLRLLPNYPNPFTASTTLPIVLDRPARLTVLLYDVLGRSVATLLDRMHGQGPVDVLVDGRGLPAGAYFVTAQALGERRTVAVLKE